ncbi:hypothetical protein KXV85_004898, partial [Aspergillus fumigatus]
SFTVWCNSDGRIQPQPSSDSLFEELLEKGQLKETPLDELVAEAIEQGKNEPNDDILDMFETLHERLAMTPRATHRDRGRPTPGPVRTVRRTLVAVDENIEYRRPGRAPTSLKLRRSRKTAPSAALRAAAEGSDRPGLP